MLAAPAGGGVAAEESGIDGESIDRYWGLFLVLAGCGWACWSRTVVHWASACGASLGSVGPILTLPSVKEERRRPRWTVARVSL
ncbi:hypothetical protein NDU88_011855 [Pleurodeles waltl]|uniref:Uncharacterized protein n=1 Tax=Pleurodeles waltl TaxID=8319 RepID=A0AAV7R0A8_PLEWA|nr:hypothetical protein NDU88_011855 [Pleurodeles waltl]